MNSLTETARLRSRTVAVVIGVLVAAIAVAWLLFREADQPVEVLPDGTVVKLCGVTYGKRHRMISGTIGQRMAGRILPRSLARSWSIPVMEHITTNDSLVVWLEVDWRAVGVRNQLYAGPTVAIGDEYGSEFASSVRTSSRITANGLITGYEMPIIPPGTGNLAVIVGPPPNTVARVRFPLRRISAEKRKPAGTRQLSPTSRVDNLEFVVRSLESFQTPPFMMYPMTRADCLILEDGRPTTNWMVRALDVLDDAGRAYRMTVAQDRNGRVSLNVGLCTNEVWRLRFFLGRTAGFASSDLVMVREVPVAVSNRARFVPVTNVVNDAAFILYDISGFGVCALMAQVGPAADPFDVAFVQAADDKGRELVPRGQASGQWLRNNSSMFSFTVKTALESETADLTFAVTRMKSLEVFVKPTAATNVASTFLPPGK